MAVGGVIVRRATALFLVCCSVNAFAAGEVSPAEAQTQNGVKPLPPLPGMIAPLDQRKAQASQLTPEEILQYGKYIDAIKRATSEGQPGVEAKPASGFISVDLTPGSAPPIVRLGRGTGSVLSFADAEGDPWQVENAVSFDDVGLKLTAPEKSNMVVLHPGVYYGTANMAVFLKGLPLPLMFQVYYGQAEADYRLDVRVPRLPPEKADGKSAVTAVMPPDGLMMAVLSGLPPDELRPVVSNDQDVKAWIDQKGLLYVVSPYPVMTPWLKRQKSVDGRISYVLHPTPLLMISKAGKETNVALEF